MAAIKDAELMLLTASLVRNHPEFTFAKDLAEELGVSAQAVNAILRNTGEMVERESPKGGWRMAKAKTQAGDLLEAIKQGHEQAKAASATRTVKSKARRAKIEVSMAELEARVMALEGFQARICAELGLDE
jgi:hypothetical protein